MKPFLIRQELFDRFLLRGKKVFTPLDFSRVFPQSKEKVQYFLETQAQEGLLFRLKRGLYALKTDPPSDEEIANALYQPSYISFEYAMARYGIIPESPYNITSATTQPTRLFTTDQMAYTYNTVKPEAYTGYYLDTTRERKVLIAEPEKALADYLYYIAIGQRSWNDRFYTARLDKNKLKEYAKLFGREKVLQLVKELP